MPNTVDEAERRSQIAAALWRVIARDGIGAASARSVAAEGGWSLGSVRYWFPSHAALLRFAAEAMASGVAARMTETVRTQRPGRRRQLALLEELLPLDDQRLAEVRAWLAVLAHAHVDPELDDLRLAAWRGSRQVCRLVVAEAMELPLRDEGRAPLAHDGERRAAVLHAAVDGLTVQASMAPEILDPARVRRELRAILTFATRPLSAP